MGGIGRRSYPSLDSLDLSYHRERAILALRSQARHDDEEHGRLQHQLEEIDRAIERGVGAMPDDERRQFLMGLHGAHVTRPPHECPPGDHSHTVDAIMTHKVITLNEEDNLTDLEPSMAQFGLRHLPVVDGSRLVGLISHRDVLSARGSDIASSRLNTQLDRTRAEGTFVASVMSRDLSTVTPETPALEAAKMLAEHKYGCLPVVDAGGNLVGIVTDHDFLHYFVNQG